jgi:hypothetical protein
MLLKEPLLHFLIIGVLIFVAYGFVSGNGPADDHIAVTRGQQERLGVAFKATWNRPPTEQELNAIIDDWIREEIAYREGVAMGLDSGDTIIRRRLRQKLEVLAEDIVSMAEPTTADLERFLADNRTDYRRDPAYSLEQVYFSTDVRGDAAQQDAEQALMLLHTDSGLINPEALGDPISLPYRLIEEPAHAIAARFGRDFAQALEGVEPGDWRGPIRSGYGLHLVRIDLYQPGRPLTLAEAEREVMRDWHNKQRIEAIDRLYERLRTQYSITIEDQAEPGPPAS